MKRLTVKDLKETMVLNLHTSDSIDPIAQIEYGARIEKELLLEIKNDKIKLYEFETGKTKIVLKEMMDAYLRFGLYEITEERA